MEEANQQPTPSSQEKYAKPHSASANATATHHHQVPLKINFSNRLQTTNNSSGGGLHKALTATGRRQGYGSQRRFSASFGPTNFGSESTLSGELDPTPSQGQPGSQLTTLVHSPSESDYPCSAPIAPGYVERAEARRAREFTHKFSLDTLHQQYRAGSGSSRSSADSKSNLLSAGHHPALSITPINHPASATSQYSFNNTSSASPSPPGPHHYQQPPSAKYSNQSLPARAQPPHSQFPVVRWSSAQVVLWLKESQFDQYVEIFQRNDVNGEVLLELSHSLLKQMGVNTVGARVRLLQAIKVLSRAALVDFRNEALSKDRNMGQKPHSHINRSLKSSTSSPSLRQDSLSNIQNTRNGMLMGETPPSFCPLTPASAQPLFSGRLQRPISPRSPPPLPKVPGGSPPLLERIGRGAPPEKDIMSLDAVQRHCVKVVGEGGQTRVVDLQNALHQPQAILAKVLAKFSLPGPASDYAIFVGAGEHTRMLTDEELMIICNSPSHPNKDKFILRKKYQPRGSGKKIEKPPAIAAGWDAAPGVSSVQPKVAGVEVVVGGDPAYRANRHSKLVSRRPDSKQIASNLAQYFPLYSSRGSVPQKPHGPVGGGPSRGSEPILNPPLLAPSPLAPPHEHLSTEANEALEEKEEDKVEIKVDEEIKTEKPIEKQTISEENVETQPVEPNSEVPLQSSTQRHSPQPSPALLSPPTLTSPNRVRASMDVEGWIQGALIGAGSFGSVFLGLLPTLGEVFAVKQVELPEAASRTENRQKSDQVKALRQEIELMRELCHPNIVQYLGSSSTDQHLNIFLEYVPGGSVAARLAERGPFSELRARHYVKQILGGLEYLHRHNIIHRDIKGGNVLVDHNDTAKIADFGVSKKVQDSVLSVITPHRVSLQGSVYWMAPEVVKQTHYTRKADIWSLGCLVIEMLTGDHPFPSFTQMQAIFKIGTYSAPELPASASPMTKDFLAATLHPKHAQRPSSLVLLSHPFVVDVPPPPSSPGSDTEDPTSCPSSPIPPNAQASLLLSQS